MGRKKKKRGGRIPAKGGDESWTVVGTISAGRIRKREVDFLARKLSLFVRNGPCLATSIPARESGELGDGRNKNGDKCE